MVRRLQRSFGGSAGGGGGEVSLWQEITPSASVADAVSIDRSVNANVILHPPVDDTQVINVPSNMADGTEMEIQLIGGGGSGSWQTWDAVSPSTPGYFFLTGAAPTADVSSSNVTPVYIKRNGVKYEAVVAPVKALGSKPLDGGQAAAQAAIKAAKYDIVMGLGVDDNGLYILQPSATARVILYTPGGSDTGPVGSGPFLYTRTTMANAKSLIRRYSGDWMLLPSSGIVMTNANPNYFGWIYRMDGASPDYPTVIGTYDSDDPTNFAKFNTKPCFIDASGLTYATNQSGFIWFAGSGQPQNYVAVDSLVMYSPNSFNQLSLIGMLSTGKFFLIQRCVNYGGENPSFAAPAPPGDAPPAFPYTSMEALSDSVLYTDMIFNKCGFGYSSSIHDGHAGNVYLSSIRRARFYDCVNMHGGWARSCPRTYQLGWSIGTLHPITSLTQVGGVATVLTDTTAGLSNGTWVQIWGSLASGYKQTTRVENVVANTSFQYRLDPSSPATSTATGINWCLVSGSGGYDPAIGNSTNIFNHNWYISEYAQDVRWYNPVSAWDCVNMKLTGGFHHMENPVEIRSPMGPITDCNGNDANVSDPRVYPNLAPMTFHNYLQLQSADCNTPSLPRANGPTLNSLGTGSYFSNALLFNNDSPSQSSRSGIAGAAHSFSTYRQQPSILDVRHAIVTNWGPQYDVDEAYTTKLYRYCITEDTVVLRGGTNQKVVDTSAAFQAKLAAVRARNVHTTFRTTYSDLLPGVTTGATDIDTEQNVLDYMLLHPADAPWGLLLQQHMRAPIGR